MRRKVGGSAVPTTMIVMAVMLWSLVSPHKLMGVSAAQLRRNLLANGLGVTPPMG